MPEEILEKLFDSAVKVRLLKLFMRNENSVFTLNEIKDRIQLEGPGVHHALDNLREIGFLHVVARKKKNAKSVVKTTGKGKKGKKIKIEITSREKFFSLNPSFVFYNELRNLVLKSSPASKKRIAERIKRLGRVKMAVLSGIFLKPERENLHTDIFIVGDDMSEKKVANFIRALEADVGTELLYSVLSSDEYFYRTKMFDRFLLDIFENPHEKIINRFKEQV
ncbi:MAG: hypothetical protein HYV65_02070 [Candidatus Spechtbacteria bacterium]|nr:hypothetical protein [Candidatus Spechtbacteria bacterium]